jgi:ABC-type molybdate transport system substrate-binding protein
MKAMLGVVSLLVVLAIGGLVMSRQLKSQAQAAAATSVAASGSVRTQVKQLEDQAASDVAKAMQQGAARNADADK